MTTAVDLEQQLISDLLAVRRVVAVELRWSPGLTVKVDLTGMDWAARGVALGMIGVYGRRRAQQAGTGVSLGGIDVRFAFPEPTTFTEARIEP